MTTTTNIAANLATLRRSGITTLRQLEVILHLRTHGPTQIGHLAALVECSTAGLTGLVDKLAAKGLVQRTTTKDRRLILVGLTTLGSLTARIA